MSALHNVNFSLQYDTQLVTWWASIFSDPPSKIPICSWKKVTSFFIMGENHCLKSLEFRYFDLAVMHAWGLKTLH